MFVLVISSLAFVQAFAHTMEDLTESEIEWLKANPVITVGIDRNWAPIEFVDHHNQPQGISVEYLSHLQRLLDVDFQIVADLPWTEVKKQFKDGRINMLSAVSETPSRREYSRFTKPYLTTPIAVFSSTESDFVGDLTSLAGKQVAVIKDYAIHEWLKRDYPKIKLLPVHNIENALKTVSRGDAIAFVGNIVTTSYYLSKSGFSHIRIVGETPYSNQVSMAVNKDMQSLSTIVQKALNAIPEYERDVIYNHWISIEYRHSTDYKIVFILAGKALLITAIMLFWVVRLRKEIAKRARVENELLEAKQMAEQASHAKSAFLANMSHELRNPMNAVLGFTTLLKTSQQTPKNQQYLNGIQTAGKSLLELIDSILDLSRIEAGKLELNWGEVNLRILFSDLEKVFKYFAIEKGLIISFGVHDNVPETILQDEVRLRQILMNLVNNAVKFTERGSIHTYASIITEKDGEARLEIEVRDTGIGIPQRHQEHIFGAFDQPPEQDQARYKGAGLGLAISKHLAQMMSGDIRLESQVGIGSTFTVLLPVTTTE